MSKVTDALARLSAVDVVLASEIEQIIADLAAEPQAIADAVKAALDAAGADEDTNAAAVDAATTAAQAMVDRIKGVLTPTPAPVEDTTGGGAADDSINAGAGEETVSGS